MSSDVEMEDLAASVIDHEETVQQLERQGRHGEEGESDQHLAVILEKCQPALAWIAAAPDASQIASHTPFADNEAKRLRKARLGRSAPQPESFDVTLNAEHMDPGQMAEVLRAAAAARGLTEQGLLTETAEVRMQFETRLKLAKYGIIPAGHARLKRAAFGHPSEEIFANLLDFYRIAWEYEPRSFPLQWDKDGKVIEAFTPDFYLPEFDLYVELTTMKQALVTRKNRKVKLLRAVYPHINIQVFYQKDFQDLVFKYGLKGAGQ